MLKFIFGIVYLKSSRIFVKEITTKTLSKVKSQPTETKGEFEQIKQSIGF